MNDALCRLVLLPMMLTLAGCMKDGDVLQRVPELQATARKANGGALGCGEGSVIVTTSRGDVNIHCGLDPIHVFGHKIKVADIHKLLRARVESYLTGKGSMSGEVGDLCYVCLYTLSLAKDPDSVPFITPLLQDENETVRRWAETALKAIKDDSKSPDVGT